MPASFNDIDLDLSAFAEKVLFSDSLEEKLAIPEGRLLDTGGGIIIAPSAVPEPGRPIELKPGMDKSTIRTPLPKGDQIADDEQRGILLHFFANHELLATELMALALLKFPDAPKAFRRGLFQTLKEEQQHTKWYLQRMADCGVRFGDFPLSRFFWDMIAPMESPLDYVSRLSLTFEQANLDYSRHYAGIMKNWGDDKTAAILEQIYRDEIAHVGYGLKWLRKWKRDDEDDWTAWSRQLVFPVSPSRAKGNGTPFNEEGRRAAGMNDDFIRQVRLFERSRGRTPNVYFFNANAENAMAGDGGKAVALLDLEKDLGILAAFLAQREDVVLVREAPSLAHVEYLRGHGLILPEMEVITEAGALAADSLTARRKLNEMRPWAWCRESVALMRKLDKSAEAKAEVARRVNSKSWCADLAEALVCRSVDKVRERVAGMDGPAVVKAPHGASGRRNRLWSEENASWVQRMLGAQKEVVVERWHEQRLFDFSVHYDMSERDGLRKLGFVRLENTEGGQFKAVERRAKFLEGTDPAVSRFLMERPAKRLGLYDDELRETLETRLRKEGYAGPVGIDAFVYADDDGTLRLRSVCEINARFTMGRVVLELAKKLPDVRNVRFEIAAKGAEIPEGSVVLNDPDQARRFLGLMRIW